LKKLLSGVLILYNVTGFLSDVLSYSRLLALGLATGVIANVVNTMGTLFGMNILGIIILVIVFIGGHGFNILINALGAYVHASRLQYVEFFGKFYESGGKAYKPFRMNTKYVDLKE
jgi:V/A-type H+/Na+-transporting ATPase subunit I